MNKLALRGLLGALAAIALSACEPTVHFSEAPDLRYSVAVPAAAAGLWSLENKDQGQRMRVRLTGRDSLWVEFFNLPGQNIEAPTARAGRTVRFAAQDWMVFMFGPSLGDTEPNEEYAGHVLIRYEFTGNDRVCLQVPSTTAFAKAINAGELKGMVRANRSSVDARVTASASDWMAWWNKQGPDTIGWTDEIVCLTRRSEDNQAMEKTP